MCNETVNTYSSTIKFVLEYYKTQEMCDTPVILVLLFVDSVPDLYKTRQICGRAVTEDSFMKYIAPIDTKRKICVMNVLMILWQH